jgi:hypothetical protein
VKHISTGQTLLFIDELVFTWTNNRLLGSSNFIKAKALLLCFTSRNFRLSHAEAHFLAVTETT